MNRNPDRLKSMMDMNDEQPQALRTAHTPTGRVMLVSWVLSLLAHVGVLSVAFLSPQTDADFDVEWLQNFENMERIGHGEFRQIEITAPRDVEEPEPEPEVAEPEPVVEESEPEVEEPEPKVEEPKPVKKTEPRPSSELAAKTTEPKEPKPKPKPKKEEANPFEGESLPGTRIEGPSNLPDLKGYGPGNAVFTALLRTDRLRQTRYEPAVRKILELVPDYRIVLENTNIDPISDLDSMFMASSRPQYIQYTFLAVRHRLENEELQKRLARRYEATMEWENHKSFPVRDLIPENPHYEDPRKILLRPGMAVMTRPEWLGQLTNPLPSESELRAGSNADVSLLDGLFQIEKAAPNDTLLLISAAGAGLNIPGIGPVKVQSARVAVSNIENPLLTIDVQFDDDAVAARFAKSCPNIRSQIVSQLPLLARGTASGFLSKLGCVAEGAYVTIKGQYTAPELEQLLGFAMLAVPQPMVLAKLPKPPPPPPPPALPAEVPGIQEDAGPGVQEGADPQIDAGKVEK